MIETQTATAFNSVQLTPQDADIVRGREIHAAEQNIERALTSFFVPAIITALLFYRDWGIVALVWGVSVITTCTIRGFFARCTTQRPPAPMPARSIRPLIAWSVVNAIVLTSFPAWVTLNANGFSLAYMIALYIGTFWSASFAQAPVFPTAVLFMLTQFSLTAAFAALLGLNWERTALLALYASGVAAALHIVRQHSALFRESVVQKLDLERKTETIGLLLKEHENQSSDWLWQTAATLHIVEPSPRFAEAIDLGEQALTRKTIVEILADRTVEGNAEVLAQVEDKLARRRSFRDIAIPLSVASQTVWFSISGRPLYDRKNRFAGYRGVMADITEARLAQARAAHLAHHDALTDLPNRAKFGILLRRSLARGRSFALLSIDLDGFKAVNDGFGHATGDAMLVEIARRLQEGIDSKDVVARLGDDEFVVQTWRLEMASVETLCRQLIEAASQPMFAGNEPVVVGASIGVAFAPADGATSADILNSADAALYRAKNDGRGTFRFFSPAMDRKLQVRQRLVQGLRTALARDEMILHYQPVIDAKSGAITGCEALLRWQHSERGMISPAEFIPAAEESGLIVPIGNWVIEHACHVATSWHKERRISVNVSPMQFSNGNLHGHINSVLKKTGLAPNRLEIEVTETVLVKDPHVALDTLRRIRALGVRVALDDFGTGYSSLSYLRLFPFDRIKIDRSFVQDLGQRQDSQVIVHAIVDIAAGLGMTITAEGIETTEQATYLRQIGCHEFQGFLFARPAPANQLVGVKEEALADGATDQAPPVSTLLT
ncbi:PAS/PAC sensor-containing diguanylate cyclase/phosphodiesterase [Salinisphaera shabanensis T35B1]|uniref:putative bifunctional diguanylate cyclase/phosphodiesterase n=1 Tax=Salinisphaera shabanensis TaxID=180542 RepID=UPI0033416BA3